MNASVRWLLTGVVVGGLAIDAYTHFDLAAQYQFNRTSTVSQETLFRVEAVFAVVAAIALIVRATLLTGLLALAVAGGALALLLTYRYVDVGPDARPPQRDRRRFDRPDIGIHRRITPATMMAPGMVMPDGSTMGAGAPARNVADAGPSAAGPDDLLGRGPHRHHQGAGAEVRAGSVIAMVKARLHLHLPVPMGTFVLTVTESTNAATAQGFAAGLRAALRQSRSVAGLTATSLSTPQGLVALVKGNDTLQVDA
jgi:hypothetical protein